jgi:hypothetical protein
MALLREGMPNLNQLADLEPLSTGDIIDRAVQIYRHNFGALLAIVSVPGLASYAGALMVAFGTTAMQKTTAGAPLLGGVMLAFGYFFAYLIGPLLLLLVIGGLTRTVADFVMLDVPISFTRTYRLIFGRIGPLLGGQLLGYLIVGMGVGIVAFIAVFLLLAVIAVSAALMSGASSVAAVLISVVFGLLIAVGAILGYGYAYSRIVFIPCSIMIEGQSASASLSRSFKLSQGTVWRVLQVFLFDIALASAVVSAIGVPLTIYGLLTGEISDPRTLPTWFLIAASTIDQLSKLLTIPIGTIAYCLLYFDCRVRQEGYDVELMAGRLAPAPPQASYTPAPAVPAPVGYRPPPVGSVLGL